MIIENTRSILEVNVISQSEFLDKEKRWQWKWWHIDERTGAGREMHNKYLHWLYGQVWDIIDIESQAKVGWKNTYENLYKWFSLKSKYKNIHITYTAKN